MLFLKVRTIHLLILVVSTVIIWGVVSYALSPMRFTLEFAEFKESIADLWTKSCDMTVPPTHSIQTAIDKSESGSVLCLEEGEYVEQVTIINKSITLRGQGIDKTVLLPTLDPCPYDRYGIWTDFNRLENQCAVISFRSTYRDMFRLESMKVSSANLMHFISNQPENSNFNNFGFHGVIVDGANSVRLSKMAIEQHRGFGIWIIGSTEYPSLLSIASSRINENYDGLVLESIFESSQIKLDSSEISGNFRTGIDISAPEHHNSMFIVMINNSIHFNTYGIEAVGNVTVAGYGNRLSSKVMSLNLLNGQPNISNHLELDESIRLKDNIQYPNSEYDTLHEAIRHLVPGGTIHIDTGVYEAGLSIDKDISIQGSEGTILRTPSGMKPSGYYPYYATFMASKRPQLLIFKNAKVNVKDLTFERGEVRILEHANLKLDQVSLQDAGRIKVEEEAALLLKNSTIHGAKIYVQDQASANINGSTVESSSKFSILGAALEFHDRSSLELSNSIVTTGGDGIFLWDNADAQIVNSSISKNGGAGIALMDKASATIENSKISGNGHSYTSIEASLQSYMKASTFGIYLKNRANLTLVNSEILNNAGWGIGVVHQDCLPPNSGALSIGPKYRGSVNFIGEVKISNNRQLIPLTENFGDLSRLNITKAGQVCIP